MELSTAADPVDVTLDALADPLRRRAVELLSVGPRRSGELADELGVSPATMSKHLRVLRRSQLVTELPDEHDARVRIYSLRAAAMADLRDWMRRTEQGWVDQLDHLRRHVEGAP